ncbi:MAG: deoxycytidylate deaminase, partial [Pseudomonadota bacterium]
TNEWPQALLDHFGADTKIGNASGTIHAETNAIVNSKFATGGGSICITEPLCPNCAKNIVEAGIKTVYIDKAGFDKDFFKRRGDEFETMSMRVLSHAGISVYSIDKKTQKIEPILEIDSDYQPPLDSPLEIEKITKPTEAEFQKIIEAATKKHKQRKISVAFVTNEDGEYLSLTLRAHVVEGYSMSNPDEAIDLLTPVGKYSFIQEPVNRMLMTLSRYGYTLNRQFFYCSQIPTSREQVNAVGAGIPRITVGDTSRSRDKHRRKAMKMLSAAKIISYN